MKTLLALLMAMNAWCAIASAQDSSLMLAPPRQSTSVGVPLLSNASFIYQPLPPEAMTKPLEKESIITVLVDYRSVSVSEGTSESRKTGLFNSVLTDWLAFDGKSIFAAPQTRGDPTIGGTLNSQLNAETEIEQRESLTFPIACKIVDIRPNGNLVIEGRRHITLNEEVWMTYLTGTVARPSIGPDRTVRDSAITDLRIEKYEEGAVRDGYARGWLGRWYGKYKAF